MHVLRTNTIPRWGPEGASLPEEAGRKIPDETLIRCTTNRALHLVLFATEACNFRCVYCYEDFRYSRMEPWVVRGVKALVSRRVPDLYDLWISWFGGEPLLAKGVVEDVMTHVANLASSNPELVVRSDMTTNAFLLSAATFRDLYAWNVRRFQISFDGPQELHDRKRVLAGGKGTFQRIWNNLLAIRELPGDFTVMIRVHVAEDNADAMPEFVSRCADTFGNDSRFELFVRPLSRLGGPHDSSLPILAPGRRTDVIARLRQLAKDRGARVGEYPKPGYVCYAAHGNSFIVRANGRLNKCTVALESPENQVGTIREDGRVVVDSKRFAPWMRGVFTGNAGELACPMKNHIRLQTVAAGTAGAAASAS